MGFLLTGVGVKRKEIETTEEEQMAFRRIVADFETRSPVDIKSCGAYKYAQHPDTDVTMLALLNVDEPSDVRMWIGPSFRHLYATEVTDYELDDMVAGCEEFIAHNAPFERAIWKYVMAGRYGFRDIDVRRVVDTAVQCSMVGLPRTLEGASHYLNGKDAVKDMEGAKVMKRFMAPRCPVAAERKAMCPSDPASVKARYDEAMRFLSKGATPAFEYHDVLVWHEDADDFRRTVEYCRRDVVAEYGLYTTLPHLQPLERDIWELDQRINDRGVLLDLNSAEGIVRTVESNAEELTKESVKLTDGEVTSMKSPLQIRKWLESNGLVVDSIDKESVKYLLSLDIPPKVRRFLEIRMTLGKSSIAKYSAMFSSASAVDSRVRGMFAFYGAGTGRWSGRLVQLQNLPRPVGKGNLVDPDSCPGDYDISEADIALAASGSPELVHVWWKDVNTLAADCIRGMVVAPEGRDFICSDFSAVEGRGLAYLAGEETELEAYRSGKDIYKVTAASIYGIPYDEVDGGGKGPQRQVGKTATLACGYSGGFGALCRFGFDKFPLSDEDASHAIEHVAEAVSESDIQDFIGQGEMSIDEYREELHRLYRSDRERTVPFLIEVKGKWIVRQWRKSHPNTVKLWYSLIEASVKAVSNPGSVVDCGKVRYALKGRFLVCRLPSGRNIYYLDPKVESVTTPWGKASDLVTAVTVNSMTKKIERRPLTASILTENVVQAFCRDLLKNSMLNLDRAGYDIVAHIHDEVLAEVDEGVGSVGEFESIMSQVPDWAEGMPLKAAGGYRAKRYRK